MSSSVLHHPRVAWDTARVVVAAAGAPADHYSWFHRRFSELLGPAYGRELDEARVRLAQSVRPDSTPVEAGLWRVRFEDLLRDRPDLAEDLRILRLQANARLARSA